MKTCALLFSGGLDSVSLAILLERQGLGGLEVLPVYMAHRPGGNVTKKELEAAGPLAEEITGHELLIVKAKPKGNDDWYRKLGQVCYSRRLPVSKANKKRRNRTFLKVAKDLGLDQCDRIALGVFGPSANANVPEADVCYDQLVKRTPWLKRGQLVTFESMGIFDKTAMLKAVGRGALNRGRVYASESCLMYFNTHCGECISCHQRADAFMEAWGQDKTRYRKGTYADRRKRRRR
ncbi:MAG: hypothetical protein E4G90_00440 [Gemmatimonadales bacterium]|nr:MAG: hypothetical protein E4G90_00440 [Gemmatimonadales bacterium]